MQRIRSRPRLRRRPASTGDAAGRGQPPGNRRGDGSRIWPARISARVETCPYRPNRSSSTSGRRPTTDRASSRPRTDRSMTRCLLDSRGSNRIGCSTSAAARASSLNVWVRRSPMPWSSGPTSPTACSSARRIGCPTSTTLRSSAPMHSTSRSRTGQSTSSPAPSRSTGTQTRLQPPVNSLVSFVREAASSSPRSQRSRASLTMRFSGPRRWRVVRCARSRSGNYGDCWRRRDSTCCTRGAFPGWVSCPGRC